MERQALDQTPPLRNSPDVSLATYFGLKQREYRHAAANVEMTQPPHLTLPQHYGSPAYRAPVPPVQVPGPGPFSVPDTRQRKLGIRPFKELYQGLGSGFQIWDVQVGILGHHISGMAERYYNQQVEGWWEEQPALEHAAQCMLHTFATKITPAQSMKMPRRVPRKVGLGITCTLQQLVKCAKGQKIWSWIT
eukprot:jgi/Phyca11/102284/e_gw1.6.1019.1